MAIWKSTKAEAAVRDAIVNQLLKGTPLLMIRHISTSEIEGWLDGGDELVPRDDIESAALVLASMDVSLEEQGKVVFAGRDLEFFSLAIVK